MSCEALNCGRREYLYDDLQRLNLSKKTVAGALELWPKLEKKVGLPEDLEELLAEMRLSPL